MIVLAIIPVVLPLVLALGGGLGLLAWFKSRKKDDKALDTPTTSPDDLTEPREPGITMASGVVQARLFRNGAVWSFTVSGPRPASAGDKSADKAAVDMLQSFASSIAGTPDAAITGTGTSSSRAVDFSVEKRGDRWDWAVTTAAQTKLPSAPMLIATGQEATRSRAALQLLNALTHQLDWLTVVSEGGGAPQPEPTRLPGIVTSGHTLAVTNLPAWISYASPLVREHLSEGHSADEIIDDIIAGGKDLPPETKLSGKPIAEVRSAVQRVVNELDAGKYRGAPPIDDKIAALIVGMDLVRDWAVSQYDGHVILVRPASSAPGGGGFGANQGSAWEYLIWEGDQRGYDENARATNTLPAGKRKDDAIKAARRLIDDGFQIFEDGGNTGATVNPDWDGPDDAGGWDPVPAAPMSVSRSSTANVTATTWTGPSSHEVTLFDFATGDNDKRRDWTIDVGLCLVPTGKDPFGTLSLQVEDAVVVNYGRFGIRQAAPGGGIGGSGVGERLDLWGDFKMPLAYKVQVRAKFRRTPGPRPFARIVAQPDEIGGDDAAAVDPCPDREERWPMPDRPDGFAVLLASTPPVWHTWKPIPRIAIIARGTKVILRVTYTGLPVFADMEGADQSPAMGGGAFTTKYKLQVKANAVGINAA